jgi:FkbM family methyltransferase
MNSKNIARFAMDAYYLLRLDLPAAKKAQLWFNRMFPSDKMLGFQITSFDRSNLLDLYREIFIRQYYIFRNDSKPLVIFDCGGNIGMATLYFKWLYPESTIHVFEPDPGSFSVLEKNVAQNHLTNVTTHNCALWDENGEIEFFVDNTKPGSQIASVDPLRMQGQSIQVPSRKLSDFIQGKVDFLKMDVEGAEHHVLDDLVQSGKIDLVTQMAIEYHHHIGNRESNLGDFLKKLEQSGFQYQILSALFPVSAKGVFQDMLIGAYRNPI